MRRRLAWGAFVVYGVLLIASYVVRARTPRVPSNDPALSYAELPIPGAEGARASVAYRTWGDWEGGTAPVVVLLHGSPGGSRNFRSLAPPLAESYRIVAPDLPGFGASQHDVPDYSVDAHAHYTIGLLDHLGVEAAHLVGYSMGGGVALELVDDRPERARSITLLSAIGAQEFELLGSYHLNHAIHGIQLVGLWLLHRAFPHFGGLDGFPLDLPYARNFYDTDQRPLRRILTELEIPTLILHGERDFLIPPETATEHERLVPHSELVMYDQGGHGMVFRPSSGLAAPLSDFIERAEAGVAPTRADASPDRLSRAREPFDPRSVPPAIGLTWLLLVLLIALCTLVSEDATSIGTGLLVAQGRIGFVAGTLACVFGILVGNMLIYAAGRFVGRPALDRVPLKWMVSKRALVRSSAWFERRGPAVVFISRFLPGTRVPVSFTAGLLGARWWRFFGYFVLAVALWTPAVVGLAAVAGGPLFERLEMFDVWALPGAAALAAIIWGLVVLGSRLSTWEGRRKLYGAVRRRLEWEFWPWWVAYLPVYPWILWLGLKHRSPTLFTASNPGIEAGGFVGEAKTDILSELDPKHVARFEPMPASEPPTVRLERAQRFMEREGLDFPVVVKPDVGERGFGFTIVRDAAAFERAVTQAPEDFLVQEYVGGVELGVFYVRAPGEARGRIFSVTDKRLLTLTGDGESTIERLILADDRAVRMAPLHLDQMAGRLEDVPAANEIVRLVQLGVHSRGSLFLDGQQYVTPELEHRIEEISRSFEGFFFGRYDMRAPSYDHFRRGEGIRVLELNGVTSEATHIYDPSNSWGDAARVLRNQWSVAFEIGAANRARGFEPKSFGEVVRLAWRHLRS